MAQSERAWPQLPEPQSRADMIVDAIRDAILRGELEPGTQLVERDLAERLGVSKTPVREALKVLSRTGLVMRHPYRGMTVREVDRRMVIDVYEVRLLLETDAARRSALLLDEGDLERLEALLGRAREAGLSDDRRTLSRINRQFHRELYGRCGNELMRSTLDGLQDLLAFIAVVAWRRNPTFSDEAAEHEAILDAAKRRDADAVASLLGQHIEGFLDRMLTVFPEPDTDLLGA